MSMKQYITLVFCLLSLLLSGCWSSHKKDGPPPYPVDVSRIPDAVPKAEPLSRLGNKPTYKVFGKTYHVLPSRKNYLAVGIASWYGTQFDKRRTSNGERYDMLAMTAAHRTLPLPTYLQVTNLENGQHVIVKVNDRGPFEPNRLIDLSYAAAKKLGMSGRGTALVEIKALDPGARVPPSARFAAHKKHLLPGCSSPLYLEVAQYREKISAARLQQRLAKMFNNHIHVKSLAQGPRVIYQVQIGPIKDKRTADHIRSRLKSIGLASKKVAYDF